VSNRLKTPRHGTILAALVIAGYALSALAESYSDVVDWEQPGFTEAAADHDTFYLVARLGWSVWALDRNTGTLKWRFDGDFRVMDPPALIGDHIIALDYLRPPTLRWLRPSDGKESKKVEVPGIKLARLMARNGVLIAYDPQPGGAGGIRCFDPSSGDILWTRAGLSVLPDAKHSLIAVGAEGAEEVAIRRLDPISGQNIWESIVPSPQGVRSVRQVIEGPGNSLWLLLQDFSTPNNADLRSGPDSMMVSALDNLSGVPKEPFAKGPLQVRTLKTGSLIDAQLFTAEDEVLLAELIIDGSSGAGNLALHSIDSASGKVQSRFRMPLDWRPSSPKVAGVIGSNQAAAGGIAIVYDTSGVISGIQVDDGQRRWKWESKFTYEHAVAVVLDRGQVLVGEGIPAGPSPGWHRLATCLDGESGQVLWEYIESAPAHIICTDTRHATVTTLSDNTDLPLASRGYVFQKGPRETFPVRLASNQLSTLLRCFRQDILGAYLDAS